MFSSIPTLFPHDSKFSSEKSVMAEIVLLVVAEVEAVLFPAAVVEGDSDGKLIRPPPPSL